MNRPVKDAWSGLASQGFRSRKHESGVTPRGDVGAAGFRK